MEKSADIRNLGKGVIQAYQTHKSYFENWYYGKPVESWRDKDGNLCIRYQSGRWFHYRQNKGRLECW